MNPISSKNLKYPNIVIIKKKYVGQSGLPEAVKIITTVLIRIVP